MAIFKTKNTKMGKFWRVLQWEILVYFMTIWSMYIFYGHLVSFTAIWYILWLFGCTNLATLVCCDALATSTSAFFTQKIIEQIGLQKPFAMKALRTMALLIGHSSFLSIFFKGTQMMI
jgi:hypothetical protein